VRRLAVALAAGVAWCAPAGAQLEVTGYALGVGSYARASDLAPAGSNLLGRTRLMLSASRGALSFDVAYEHLVTRTPAEGGFSFTTPGGAAARAGDWLGADWVLRSTSRSEWRHRLDRVNLALDAGPVQLVAGRQAISWATTLILTPADPFAPFDPSDPFREYRGGVDALRMRVFAGPFSEVEAVVRPTETALGTTLTALARLQTSWRGWSVGGWGGVLHDEAAVSAFATGALGATAMRFESSLREAPHGGSAFRGTLGVDRFFTPGGRDLYAIAELQYDDFGAPSASTLLDVIRSKPFVRGEMQLLGRWTAASQISYQLHPLVGVDLLVLLNLEDGSALLGPGLSWSASGSASVRAGAFTGSGRGTRQGAPGSEYGSVPGLGYLSISWFF
jgi:hypothetical protein